MEHELAYLRYLEKLGFKARDLRALGNEEEAIVETVKLMKQGPDSGATPRGRRSGEAFSWTLCLQSKRKFNLSRLRLSVSSPS